MALTEVNSKGIKDADIATGDIADDAITSAKIADDAVVAAAIADNAVVTAGINADAITGAKIADDAIDSEHYTDGSIDTAHIADNQITLAKMAGGTDGQIITYDASGDPVAVGPGTDGQVLTSTGAGSPPAFEDAAGGAASFRNLIINGAFNVAQRATSGTGSGFKSVDRFYISKSADEDPTQAQHALTSSDTGPWAKGFRNSFHITNGNNSSNTGGNQSIWYEVEAQDIANSGWNYNSASSYITLSFWVKSSVAQTFYAYIVSNDGTNKRHAFSLGSLSANTWTQVTKSFPGHADLQFDNDTGKGLSIGIHMFAPTGQTDSGVSLTEWATHSSSARMPDFATTWWHTNDATFEITGVQLEVGAAATDFEHRQYNEELIRCQRYYQVIGDIDNDPLCNIYGESAIIQGVHHFRTEMRAVPSVHSSNSTDHFKARIGVGNHLFDTCTFNDCSNKAVIVYGNLGSGTYTNYAGILRLNHNDAYLSAQAEL